MTTTTQPARPTEPTPSPAARFNPGVSGDESGTPDPAYVVLGLGHGAPGHDERALEFAAQEAVRRGVPIKVVHGCGVGGHGASHRRDGAEIAGGRRLVEDAAERLRTMAPGTTVHLTNTVAGGTEAMLAEARTAHLLVVHRRDLGLLARVFAAGLSATVAARAACPVAIVPDGNRPDRAAGVVVGVDAEGRSAGAVAFAFDEARRRGVPLTAFHAWMPFADTTYGYLPLSEGDLRDLEAGAAAILERALAADRRRRPEVEVHTRSLTSTALEALAAASRGAAVVVVARHGESQHRSWALGATTRGLLTEAHCPVIVAPPTLG